MTPQQVQAVFNRATCLFTYEEIQQTLDKMALEINEKMKDMHPIVMCVMNGGIVTMGHLLTRLDFPLEVDYVHATRYRGNTRGNDLFWYKKPSFSLEGRTILLVDDILDGGITLSEIVKYCKQQSAASVYTSVLLDKYQKRVKEGLANADFVGLPIDDHFVVGFGMDYHEYLRNVPGIYRIADEDM